MHSGPTPLKRSLDWDESHIFDLRLADGFYWRFIGDNEGGAICVSRLARIMGLHERKKGSIPICTPQKDRYVSVKSIKKVTRWRDLPSEHGPETKCTIGQVDTQEKLVLQLVRVSHVVVDACERKGGLLVHGALAAWNGMGMILCGPSGVGKSTASSRLPRTWRSLCDDTTLIVRSADGRYWAHPWPTWSRFREGKTNATWEVGTAVPLTLICMLTQDKKDKLAPLPSLQAISELVEVSGQAFVFVANGMSKEAFRRINLMRFHNAVTISKKVPTCRLEISRNGRFWKEIELFLESCKQ